MSNIEAHNKCYTLLPDFISGCLSLDMNVNYVIPFDNKFKIIPVGDNYLDLLKNLRKESNEHSCDHYDARMCNIRKSMIDRDASQEQFDELKKIENIYLKIKDCDSNNKIHKR